jgi:hypothetical protein
MEAAFLTPEPAAASDQRVPLLRIACGLCASFFLGACLFPVFEFEEHSAPRQLAYGSPNAAPARDPGRVGLSLPPSAAGPRQLAPPPRPAGEPRASVLAPAIPEPEQPIENTPTQCYAALRRAGVHFLTIARDAAPGVRWPIRLTGPIHGVSFDPLDASAVNEILDCRLAIALLEWSADLNHAGVRRVQYFSMYRPGARIGGDGAVSGHAHGMAIDAARFTTRRGVEVDVLEDWEGRRRGQDPCPLRSDESGSSRLLRGVTCAAADRKLFQVVLTPHYNKAHENHVHLELKPEVDWTYVR